MEMSKKLKDKKIVIKKIERERETIKLGERLKVREIEEEIERGI